MSDITLHGYQLKLKNDVYGSWQSGNRNTLAVLPTGSGKSICVSDIALDFSKAGAKQSVIAHRNELVSQMSMHLANRKIYHQIIGPDTMISQITKAHRKEYGLSFVNPSAPCSVAGVDTIMARSEELKSWANQQDLWTIDEAHHVIKTNKWGKAVDMFHNARGLGVTATPSRADGLGLGADYDGVFHDMLIGPSMRELISWGNLSDYEIVMPESDLQMTENDIGDSGDYSKDKLKKAAQKSHIVGDVVREYCRYALGKQAICFATDVETAGDIANKFNDAGISAAALSAKTPTAVREKFVNEFKTGKLKILVNVDLFGEGFDCLDQETEVLTPNGWKNYINVAFEKECYAFNTQSNKIEIVPIEKYGVRKIRAEERFCTMKSQHLDIRVTEGHNIYYRKLNHLLPDGMGAGIHLKKAKEIVENQRCFALPLSAEMEFEGLSLSDDEIRLIGWYMTDGWLCKTGLFIAQSKEPGVDKIKKILENLGYDYTYRIRSPARSCYNNSKPCYEFRIPKGTAFGTRKRNGWKKLEPYLKKNPVDLLHKMTREQFKVFWESLLDGDGTRQEGKSGTLCTARKEQADFYVHMATVRGYAAMYGTYKTKKGVTIYNLRIRDKKWLKMKPKDYRSVKLNFEESIENELVWCLNNNLGTLITRRNGKIAILGNCPATEAVIMARPTASLGLYLQMVGRGLRVAPNKPFGLIIDHVSNVIRHGLPDKFRLWSLARRDKRGKQAKDPEDIELTRCKSCTKPYEKVLSCCPYCGAYPPLPEPRERTIAQVDGNLILLDRAKLEEMRRASVVESAGDVAERSSYKAGPYAAARNAAHQIEKIAAHKRLSEAIAQWAGIQRSLGRPDEQTYKRFYLTTGLDVLGALASDRTRQEYDEMSERIEGWINDVMRRGV